MNQSEIRSLVALPIILLVAGFIAWAGSQGGFTVNGIPLYVICVGLAFVIQWIAFIPSYIKQTEKFYDLVGSITYLTVVWIALILSPVRDVRGWLLVSLVTIWATRLGSFLFRRVRAAGEDRRFRELKTSLPRFLLTWTLQGMWVALTLAAALAAITTKLKIEPGIFTISGALIWLLGFGFEVVADRQKSEFRADPANKEKFINVGLWSWSRHPNYFGEIVLWIGVALIAAPVLRGWQWLTMISPVFVFLLLTRLSGVPLLERHADEKWGGQPDYEEYKDKTPVLFPRPPSSGN